MLFMTTETSSPFSRHDASKTAHRLQRAILIIEKLKMQRFARWSVKGHRTVFFNGNRSQDAFDAIGLHDRHDRAGRDVGPFVPVRVCLGIDLDDAQVFDLPLQFFRSPLINVVAIDHTRLRLVAILPIGPGHGVGKDRRSRPRLQRHGVKDVIVTFVDQFPIAVYVHQVEHEFPVAFGRDKEIVFAQRIG